MKSRFFWFLSLLILIAYACKEDEIVNTDPKPDDPDTEYVIPTYNDDYTFSGDDIASWGDRSKWNLANVHDPSVVFDGEYYYMYGTDASFGNEHAGKGHFHHRRSKDLVNWEYRNASMYEVPAWVKTELNKIRETNGLDPIDNPIYGFWAPVVRKVGSKFRMYYSIIIDNYIGNGKPYIEANFDGTWSEHAFIGMMETSDLAGNVWEDKGMVVHSVSDKGTDWSRSSFGGDWGNAYFYYNAIDPTFQESPDGKQYLIYGSWHSGITYVELDPSTGKPFEYVNVADRSKRIATRVANGYWSRWQGSEGPEILYNEETGYYYLFLAYDGLDVPYNTRVCRATSIEGPYYGSDGANITEGADCYPIVTHPYKFNDHSGWVGFAHNAVFQNKDGDWFYASQARLPHGTNGNEFANANMMGHVRKIRWTEEGWPVVMPERYTGVPEEEISKNELVGTWECITLKYDFSNMQTSKALVLNESGSASGALTGTWSYDSASQMLTIGALKLCIEREVDWEANPREITVVFSGLTEDSKHSIWGKKVD